MDTHIRVHQFGGRAKNPISALDHVTEFVSCVTHLDGGLINEARTGV